MDLNKEKYDFNDFIEVIKTLRSPEGCKWDIAQTHDSIKDSLIEESYELLNEIEKDDVAGMKEELGDVLLQVVFHSQIASEDGKFDINDVIDGITKKMIFRHPHVFGNEKVSSEKEAYDLFYKSKGVEKQYSGISDELYRIPKAFPSLMKSYKITKKLHKVQPDIFAPSFDANLRKVYEEIDELKEAYELKDKNKIEDEFGDVLCTIVSLGRVAGADAEISLNKNCDKIRNRVEIIEDILHKNGKHIDEISVEEFRDCWKRAKIIEKNTKM